MCVCLLKYNFVFLKQGVTKFCDGWEMQLKNVRWKTEYKSAMNSTTGVWVFFFFSLRLIFISHTLLSKWSWSVHCYTSFFFTLCLIASYIYLKSQFACVFCHVTLCSCLLSNPGFFWDLTFPDCIFGFEYHLINDSQSVLLFWLHLGSLL